MKRLTYARAGSIGEALKLLNVPGLRSRPLAGGTDLLLLLRERPEVCDRVVDISLLPELHGICREGERVTIGAAVTFSEVLESLTVCETAPVLAQACQQVGAVQIRNMGTLGGNVVNAAACADSLPALVCLDAVAKVVTPEGEFERPVAELVVGPNRTLLTPGSLLVSLSYEVPAPGSRSVFLKLGRRNAMAISRLTVAALGRLDAGERIVEARLVPGSATPRIRRFSRVEALLLGQKPEDGLFAMAAGAAAAEMTERSGRRWSSAYKEPALVALVARALRYVFAPEDENGTTSHAPGRSWVNPVPGGNSWTRRSSAPVAAPAPGAPASPAIVGGSGDLQTDSVLTTISFTLNGAPVSVDAPAHISLLKLLRDYLNLTGTKEGCGVGECGACSVLLDGRLVNSCQVLAPQAGGRQVVTIEGIHDPDGGPNDLQRAFIDDGAVQCGFCIPGMVLASEALLARTLHPTRAEIRAAIAGNLCRCTGYQQIVDAVEHTARSRRE
jgi:xanthine dehydrogenase iron-sulfur cluster and FAD-binding subunit A